MLVSLVGPLGSGKTTLAKGIAKGLLITDLVLLVGALSAGSTPVEPPPVTMPQPVVVRISSRT